MTHVADAEAGEPCHRDDPKPRPSDVARFHLCPDTRCEHEVEVAIGRPGQELRLGLPEPVTT